MEDHDYDCSCESCIDAHAEAWEDEMERRVEAYLEDRHEEIERGPKL